MSIIDNIPENRNFLNNANFRFFLKKTPNVNYFCQEINLPGLNIPATSHPNPFVNIPYPGDHIDYEPLEVTFIVDEDLKNYLEIFNWLTALGFPQSHDQYAEIANKNSVLGEGIRSDASLFIMTNKNNPQFEVSFIDAFPVNLSGLRFTSTLSEHVTIQATATFLFIYYEINPI